MITVIPFHSEDAARAERLLDLIYWQSGKAQSGTCLLVHSPDVHQELQIKVRLTAEMCFSSVDMMRAELPTGLPRVGSINFMFKSASQYVRDCYKEPWLWLEPDCVPMVRNWQVILSEAYDAQPRRYMGRFMQGKAVRFMSRVGVYPTSASTDLAPWLDGETPFERSASILPRCHNTAMFHVAKYDPNIPIPETAVIVNGDRTGALVELLIEKVDDTDTVKRGPGRPRKTQK